jgi:UDP-N-acetyl-D-glucosamine/UDP-N-acetyl-D-galactosamine dehydrogenase
MSILQTIKIGVIGLGYVGLPLAIEFAMKYNVVGYDIDFSRVNELNNGLDKTNEADLEKLNKVLKSSKTTGLYFSNNDKDLKDCNIFIVTVPTPIDKFKSPDLTPLLKASQTVGTLLKKDDIVIYESTVYPGCTEEDCVPVLEKFSGLIFNKDFYCGYSPERINPGDKVNTLTKIIKVISGSDERTTTVVDSLYSSIITAGTHRAPNIKVAEASKAIENAQRDVNISFVNELALMFDKIGIDTNDVLEAAGTKWNFLKYKPGLVGGHCIGVDPYYLSYKAESVGYHPQVILSGRRVNDYMGIFIANKVIKLMIENEITINKKTKILIMGITFKENCPDIRNTKIVDVYNELVKYNFAVEVYDPLADPNEVYNTYGIKLNKEITKYDAIILATAHEEFKKLNFTNLKINDKSIIYDVKSFLDKKIVTKRL